MPVRADPGAAMSMLTPAPRMDMREVTDGVSHVPKAASPRCGRTRARATHNVEMHSRAEYYLLYTVALCTTHTTHVTLKDAQAHARAHTLMRRHGWDMGAHALQDVCRAKDNSCSPS